MDSTVEIDDGTRKELVELLQGLQELVKQDADENNTPYIFNKQRAMLSNLLSIFEWKYYKEHEGDVICSCGEKVDLYMDVDAEMHVTHCDTCDIADKVLEWMMK